MAYIVFHSLFVFTYNLFSYEFRKIGSMSQSFYSLYIVFIVLSYLTFIESMHKMCVMRAEEIINVK